LGWWAGVGALFLRQKEGWFYPIGRHGDLPAAYDNFIRFVCTGGQHWQLGDGAYSGEVDPAQLRHVLKEL
jgi:hypothetical protein